MSRTTPTDRQPWQKYVDFLNRIGEHNNLIAPLNHKNGKCAYHNPLNKDIWFSGEGKITFEGGDSRKFNTQFRLVWIQPERYVVQQFEVVALPLKDQFVNPGTSDDSLFLKPEIFFEHFGFGVVKDSEKMWRINIPRDIETFMVYYDRLAKIYGKQPIFNLP